MLSGVSELAVGFSHEIQTRKRFVRCHSIVSLVFVRVVCSLVIRDSAVIRIDSIILLNRRSAMESSSTVRSVFQLKGGYLIGPPFLTCSGKALVGTKKTNFTPKSRRVFVR
ncbi:MAG: hypothetical protein DI553_00465 [Cutibacterium acnes]|nr:MAG: hypothetical protein DI553_00465 [Cutibacterium acnes]